MLAEQHGFKVSRETVRKWMVEDGLWLSRKQRRTFHQPRQRQECFGGLIQIYDSEHRWFKDRVDPCTHRRGPWRSFEAVEYATFEWVDWFNNRRLLDPIGNIPPAEAEANF